MTSLTRFTETLQGSPTDRRCCMPLVFGYAANAAGISLKDALTKAEALASSQLLAQKLFGYDAVYVYGGSVLEVESLGAPLVFPKTDYPYLDPDYRPGNLNERLDQPLPDPTRHSRMPILLQAAKVLRQEIGRQVPVVGVVTGPVTVAAQVLGLETMLLLFVEQPERIQSYLEKITILSRNLALALLEAGAHGIMIMDPVSSQSIIPLRLFRQFSLPWLRKIFQSCREAGALTCCLTITGKVGDFLPLFPDTGADMVTLDYEVAMDRAFQQLPETVVQGNVRPFDFVERGPDDIRNECLKLLRLAENRRGYILSAGCELPLNSKKVNVEAMMSVV
ncbi:MAG: uroporphyrinogen decarboxylase [Peptococcaceae bacterium]|nr:uroporphyrinogen decarboxylase [Peptococcaceae bacterium]